MKEEIIVKNGVLKKFKVDEENIEILKIGYTLTEDGEKYSQAIIIREGEGTSIITDNSDVIMRFFTIYAKQKGITLDKVFEDPYIVQLYGDFEKKLNDLIQKNYYLKNLCKKKSRKEITMILLSFLSCVMCGVVSFSDITEERLAYSLTIFVSSFISGKLFKDVISMHTTEMQINLDNSIQEFSDEVLDADIERRI